MPGPHVLQIIDGLNIGGAEVLLRDLTAGLIKRGFRVSVAYGTPGPLLDDLTALKVPLFRVPRILRVDPLQLYHMYRLSRQEAPVIVHTHLFKSDFHGRLAARLAGVPVVVSTLHSIDRWAEKKYLGALYGLTARFADRIIAVSDDVQNFHAKHTGVEKSRFVTIENGVEVGRFVGQEKDRQTIRKSFAISDDVILLGVVGRLTPPKDHETFLRAAKIILEKNQKVRFLIVGDGPLRDQLTQLARDLDIAQYVTFSGFRKDIPAILAALDVLVISSIWEGLPVNLLEGMAASKPVVATVVGGIPAVATKETAFLVQPSDPLSLAQSCLMLVNDSDMRARMGRAGYERVLERYSLDAMVDRTASLYAELLAARGLQKMIPPAVAERVAL